MSDIGAHVVVPNIYVIKVLQFIVRTVRLGDRLANTPSGYNSMVVLDVHISTQ